MGRPARRFFAPGGCLRAAGLLGVGQCVRLPRRPCAGICAGRASRVAVKSPGDVARGELSFPPFFGDPKKGGAGAAGARSPRGVAWDSPAFRVTVVTRPTCTVRHC